MKLNKYQLGGGTEESEQYAMLTASIEQAIVRGQTPQSVYESLVARKMEQKMALQLVSNVVQQMLENGTLEEQDLQQSKQKDADAEKALLEDQQLADEELEKDNAAEEQMNAYNQQSSDVALDTSGMEQEEEDLNSMYSDDQYGFQAGGATKEDIYNSQFDEEENEEEPFSMESLLKSTLGTQNFNFTGIQDFYMPYSPIGSSSDLQFVDFSNTPEAKYGGAHKKQFAKNVLNLLKKAEGGSQEDEVVDTNKAVQTDDLTGTVQKKQSSFVEAMGNTAKKLKIDEWFDKLKKVGDPMLDQILNPVPKEDPMQQQQQQVDQMLEQGEEEYEEEDGEEEMRLGGGKRRRKKRQYNRILNQANRLLGRNDYQSMGNRQLPFGNLPTNQYSKFNNFTDQRFNTIDAPALQKYFIDLAKQQLAQKQDNVLIPSIDVYERGLFGRAKKYRVSYNQPESKSAEAQAEEVVVKNNNNLDNNLNKSLLIPYEGYDDNGTINPAPPGTTYDFINEKANKPLDWQMAPSPGPVGAPQFNNGGQYGGFVSPSDELSPENLARFIYGGNDSYGESKNVDDPYFSDMDAYPEMGRGGNRRRAMRNYRRATNTTARDYLFPANRGIYNAGSYAQQQGMPFIAGTNNIYSGSMANMPLHSRNVTKTGVFGKPKQWTDYYGTGTGTSNKQEEIKLNKEYANEEEYFADQRPDYSGLNPITQMRARMGDAKSKRQTDRGIRKGMDQPMEGAITGYDNIKLLKKDLKEGENWRGTPIRTAEGLYYDANQKLKLNSEAPYGTIDNEENNTLDKPLPNWQNYKPSPQPSNTLQFQDGGPTEEKFNFYDELENTMYDYEPDAYPSSYRRGGYLPKAQFGLDGSPISYTNNPAFVGQAEVDWTSSGQDMLNTGLEPSSFWADQQSFNAAAPVNLNQGELPTQYNIDPNQAEEYQTKKQLDPNALIGVNRKRKNMIGVDPQAALETGNASANFILGKIDQGKNAASQAQFVDQNFDPMKLYGKKDRIDKGDYEINNGGFDLANTGSNRLGRSAQYGGMYYQGGMYDEYLENEEDYLLDDEEEENEYKKGGEKITFMSEKQIKAFLAAGGELKFI